MTVQTTTPADLATIGPTPLPRLGAGAVDLIREAEELEAAHRFGTALAKTQFVPAMFQGKPDDVAAAVLAGRSVGMDPITSLQNIFVVKGKPAMYARTMHAIVLAAGHEIVRTAAAPDAVTVAARRRGHDDWQEFTWTIERATQAGYTSNAKYKSDPIAMLTAKALAEACRTIAPDVLTGVSATAAEEIDLEDMGERPAPPVPAPSNAAARLAEQRARAAKVRPAPTPESTADLATGEIVEEARDWATEIEAHLGNRDALLKLHEEAKAAGAEQWVIDMILSAGRDAAEAAKAVA